MATSLEISKKRSRSIICTHLHGEKILKIGPADAEIICLQEITKKDKNRKKLEMRGKA